MPKKQIEHLIEIVSNADNTPGRRRWASCILAQFKVTVWDFYNYNYAALLN